MPLQTSTWSDIRAAAKRGNPFCVRYEYSGYNGANASGRSSKFWCYERTTHDGPIHVRYGKIGTYGQVRNEGLSFYDACDRADKKVAKGYLKVSMQTDTPTPAALPPLSEWAATMPAPFNTIAHIGVDGLATDDCGRLVCQMTVEDATRIRAQYRA